MWWLVLFVLPNGDDYFRCLLMIYALHGGVGMARDWHDFSIGMKNCGEGVARVDLWKFLSCCPMPINEFGAAFNREVQGDGNVLLGYSMGGRLALHALLDDPKRWRAAVIVSSHIGLVDEDRLPRQVDDAHWAAMALTGDWDTFLSKWNRQEVCFMDWSLGMQSDLFERLEEVSCPVLWVVGERDLKFCEIGKKAVEVLIEGELCVVEGCGHRVPWEQPELFLERVKFFLGCD